MNERHVVVVLSGGLDSTTLLYLAKQEFRQVDAISVNYGQRHSRELEAAARTCETLDVPHRILDMQCLNSILKSVLTDRDGAMPEGHYQSESMKTTVVPNRNMLLLSIATAFAISLEADVVAYGAHAGDHAIYPDCRPIFIHAIRRSLAVAHYNPIELWTPFEDMTKGDVLSIAKDLGVRFENTWTCYKGGVKACGKCGACNERLEAFEECGLVDPLEYEAHG